MTGHFEAKKHAYRQTQDGIVVSFVIHPNDVDAVFAVAPLGTRYMVGFAEIGDDGEPEAPDVPTPTSAIIEGDKQIRELYHAKERRPFASLPLSQQAALRCSDTNFQQWIVEEAGAAPESPIASEDAAIWVRQKCGVKSRSELDDVRNDWPRHYWGNIESKFQSWLTTQRYASVAR